ncbi:hypothetical protein SAPIO_CDS8096 [Scedosporium apiospermum]|uniref:Uncharacterized protein n=1 Tax=Pseudallescheria apiosperma TaxID=563466 RepID=A0A084FYV9_PSEDA|nr:uncharacterized protein SAPIO_CDS8096 [Scedosporium apiospermum]KEZ40271.1 hypothetical protein SAPIO_CDS8096 [Scedosporium apiospermum]
MGCFRHHMRHMYRGKQGQLGWLRTMLYSSAQMVIRADPVISHRVPPHRLQPWGVMDEAGNPVPGKGYNMVQGMVVLDDEDHKNCTKTLLGFSQSNGEKLPAVRLTPKSDDGPLEYDSEWPTTPNSCLPRC